MKCIQIFAIEKRRIHDPEPNLTNITGNKDKRKEFLNFLKEKRLKNEVRNQKCDIRTMNSRFSVG